MALDLINFLTPMPDPFGDALTAVADSEEPWFDNWQDFAVVTGVLVGFGGLTALWMWRLLRRFLRAGGKADAIAFLDARPPRSGDLVETQFANSVAEMAIAAGLSTPDVAIVDGPMVNAAIFGTSHEDFAIVVGRPMLDELDRSQIQGATAYLVASAGNGDLEMAHTTTSASLVSALVPVVVRAPFDKRARKLLWSMARPSRVESGGIHRALYDLDLPDDSDEFRFWAGLSWMFGILINGMSQLVAMAAVRPWLGAFWRRRTALADAAAVQLTRSPDGLAGALVLMLDATRVGFPSPLAHLSAVVGEEVRQSRQQRELQRLSGKSDDGFVKRIGDVATVMSGAGQEQSSADDWGEIAPPTVRPTIDKRLKRLAALGAEVPTSVGKPVRRTSPRLLALSYPVMVGLIALIVVLMLGYALMVVCVIVLLIEVGLLAAVAVLAPLNYLLRHLAGT
jgi:hypothetical protein